jgi:opacity protein-like surface antigen
MFKKIFVLVAGLIAINANAATVAAAATTTTTPVIHHHRHWKPVFTASTGFAFINTRNQTEQFNEFTFAQFILKDHSYETTQMMWGAFAGVEFPLKPLWQAQLGFGFYVPSCFTVRGNEIQQVIDSPGTTDNFPYTYEVTTKQFLAEGKLLYTWRDNYHPFVTAGLGASFNKARSYSINYPTFLTFVPIYAPRSSTEISYRLGLGMDFDMARDVRLGLGYYFSDFGQTQLGRGNIDSFPVPGAPRQNTLYTNELLGQITLLF